MAIARNRWIAKEASHGGTTFRKSNESFSESSASRNELLNRCIVGRFTGMVDNLPTCSSLQEYQSRQGVEEGDISLIQEEGVDGTELESEEGNQLVLLNECRFFDCRRNDSSED
ncbi:hypothetical protein H5410_005100 [Solanum commersonii]|uniref:Uncharacterized protein n=1 Tax=Solanum commersonii TaxID=4109 RepID=A0A9J6A685_SOLCO|nr:hypothetical protein H5410_005100 [Solanum commersonii]